MSRGQKIVAGVLATVVCAVLGLAGTDRVALVCSRDSSRLPPCHIVRTSVFFGESSFPSTLAEVREQRRVNTGKRNASPRWTVALLDRRGAEAPYGSFDSQSEAAALAARVRAFVADPDAAPFRVEDDRGPWPYLLLVGAVAAAAWTASVIRLPSSGPALGEALKTRLARHWPALRWIVLIIVVSAIGQGALMWYADRTQGWLIFEAESRCLFGGGEMMPGASVSMSIDPGRHCARVFNPNVAGSWEEQCFDVSIGQTTTVRCRPTIMPR